MKQILSLLLLFFSWSRLIAWVCLFGLALFAFAVYTSLGGNAETAWKLLKASYVFAFAMPYFTLPGYFRNLISNQRLAMVPGFFLKAGIALFIATLLGSVGLQIAVTWLGLDTLPPGSSWLYFVVASTYMGYSQLFMGRRRAHLFMAAPSFLMVYLLFVASRNGVGVILVHDTLINALVLVCLACWGLAFYLLMTRTLFSRPTVILLSPGDREGFQSLWKTHDRHPNSSTTAGTLLLGLPDGYRPLLRGGAMWILVFPFSVALCFKVMDLILPGSFFPPFSWTFIAASGFLGGWSTFANGEFAARSRLLWLRYGSDRRMLWWHMEKIMWKNWGCIYVWAIVAALVMSYLSLFDTEIIVNYLLFIPTTCCFLLYLSILTRISGWPEMIKGFMYILVSVMIMISGGHALGTGDFSIINLVEVLMLLLGFVFRFMAQRAFQVIDWYQVQPFRISAILRK